MTEKRLALGAWGEDQAAGYLKKQGMKILARNFSTPVGEIDIIAQYKNWIVFVEVKTRRSTVFGTPQEAVGQRKQQQIIRTAQWYLQSNRSGKLQPRFDVVAILCQSDDNAEITHLPNAFSLAN
ncbi:MAG: YraN family protein [Deltaproteobacteria bacterium]|jgi:putative endonuclease|nr:YraN family protein [Deltaproteobacteria bacterium]MCW8892909.1 YraN family protein [Deltaproteobacteria bacterium]MCW9048750.1 YraN family protein [Deltaproteobacteria bacterium]